MALSTGPGLGSTVCPQYCYVQTFSYAWQDRYKGITLGQWWAAKHG